MECIDRVDVCHSESAFCMTASDTITALQKNPKTTECNNLGMLPYCIVELLYTRHNETGYYDSETTVFGKKVHVHKSL